MARVPQETRLKILLTRTITKIFVNYIYNLSFSIETQDRVELCFLTVKINSNINQILYFYHLVYGNNNHIKNNSSVNFGPRLLFIKLLKEELLSFVCINILIVHNIISFFLILIYIYITVLMYRVQFHHANISNEIISGCVDYLKINFYDFVARI